MINKAIVNLSRHVALVGTTLLIFGVCAYFAMQGYFGLGHSWVVPMAISASDDKALELETKAIAAQTQMDMFDVDMDKQEYTKAEATAHRAALLQLEAQLNIAMAEQTEGARKSTTKLATLAEQKRADIVRTQGVVDGSSEISNQLHAELRAGLITKTEFITSISQVGAIQNGYTDALISEQLVHDGIREKDPNGLAALDTAVKIAELHAEIAQLDVVIRMAHETIISEGQASSRLSQVLSAASGNPYSRTVGDNKTDVLFVPYETKLKRGDPIYNCILGIVGCYRVGTVQEVFPIEQLGQNPAPLFFKTPVRGYTVSAHFDSRKEAESKILFASKPVGF